MSEARKSLEEALARSDPRFVTSREFLRSVVEASAKGSLTTDDVLVNLAGAIASLERRVIALEASKTAL